MGRDKINEDRVDHYTVLVRKMMKTPAWRALPTVAQALYPWLRLEWKGRDYNRNGSLSLSVRDAADRLGVSVNTAARAFHALQEKGFIVITQAAHLGFSGEAKCPTFEITELALPGQKAGRKLYLTWNPDDEFPVVKAATHNPSGRNGREKANPCRKNDEDAVIKKKTKPGRVSS